MANIGAYSRHKMLEEVLTPLYSATKGGDTYFLTPSEQQAALWANITNDLTDTQLGTVLGSIQGAAALPTGAAVTTSATTALSYHYRMTPVSGLIKLALTNFAFGTLTDNAATGFGASLISFPTETLVLARYLAGTITGTGADNRTTAIEVGLGTTIASGAVSVLSGTAAFESILGGTASSAFSDAGTTSTATVVAPASDSVKASVMDGVVLRTTTPGLAVFLNAAGAAQDVTANMTMTITGTVILEYVYGP